MLIFLSAEISELIASDNVSELQLAALEDLASVVRSGRHLVAGDYDALKALSEYSRLGQSALLAYKSLLGKYSQFGAVLGRVVIYTRIVKEGAGPWIETVADQRIVNLPLECVARMSINQCVDVVFEDMSDRYLYEVISNWYVSKRFGGGFLHRAFKPVHGGGVRTAIVYAELQEASENFCLCITDSDKKYPADTNKQTSVDVRSAEDINAVLSYHLDLDFHEVENLLPLSFLSECAPVGHGASIVESLRRAELNGYPEAKLYLDYKKGIKLRQLRGEEKARTYWMAALGLQSLDCVAACGEAECDCAAVQPWPAKREVRSRLRQLEKIIPDDCRVLSGLWWKIGAELSSWTAASSPKIT